MAETYWAHHTAPVASVFENAPTVILSHYIFDFQDFNQSLSDCDQFVRHIVCMAVMAKTLNGIL